MSEPEDKRKVTNEEMYRVFTAIMETMKSQESQTGSASSSQAPSHSQCATPRPFRELLRTGLHNCTPSSSVSSASLSGSNPLQTGAQNGTPSSATSTVPTWGSSSRCCQSPPVTPVSSNPPFTRGLLSSTPFTSRSSQKSLPPNVLKAMNIVPKKSDTFLIPVILLLGPWVDHVPTKEEQDFYRKHKLMCSLAELNKTWTAEKMNVELKKLFGETLAGNEISILERYKKKLYLPFVKTPLDGNTVFALAQKSKAIYLRPKYDLFETCETDHDYLTATAPPTPKKKFKTSTGSVNIPGDDSSNSGTESCEETEIKKIENFSLAEIGFEHDAALEFQALEESEGIKKVANVSNLVDAGVLNSDEHCVGEKVKDILKEKAKLLDSEGTICIAAPRGAVFMSACSYLAKINYFYKHLEVTFTDLLGVDEGAYDAGGLTREFFTLCYDEILLLDIFAGQPYEFDLVFSARSNDLRIYYFVGLIISLSLVNGGPGPHFFSEYAYSCIVKGVENVKLYLENVHDSQIKEDLEALKGRNEGESYEDSLRAYANQQIPAYNQLREGLEVLGILDAMSSNPEEFKVLFVADKKRLTSSQFKNLCRIVRSDALSERAAFDTESVVLSFWYRLLQSIENGDVPLTFEQILSFATGLRKIPATGFTDKIEIKFNHENPMETFPIAGTCGLLLILPISRKDILIEYTAFAADMSNGIVNSLNCFGKP